MEQKESDFQTMYKQHIHENMLLRQQNRNMDTNKATKLRELNTAEANFKARYKKYIKPRNITTSEIKSLPPSPRPAASPRPHFIICKDLPYSFKTWENLTNVSDEKEGLDVYKSEVLNSEEHDEREFVGRRRCATVPVSDLASRITKFRNKRRQAESPTDHNETDIRSRSQSFCNTISRKKMAHTTITKSKSDEHVTSELTSLLPTAVTPTDKPVSFAALLRCPEKVQRSTIPSIVVTTDTGLKIPIDTNRRRTSCVSAKDQVRLNLYIQRRRKSCIGIPFEDRPKTSTEALKEQVGLQRLLGTSRYLSVSTEYIDKIDSDSDGKDYLADSFKELKKCRYLRNQNGDGQADQLPPIQNLTMPPLKRSSLKTKHV